MLRLRLIFLTIFILANIAVFAENARDENITNLANGEELITKISRRQSISLSEYNKILSITQFLNKGTIGPEELLFSKVPLSVRNRIRSSRLELLTNGNEATPVITFFGDIDTGIYKPEVNGLAFTTGGNMSLFSNGSGYIGINTLTPEALLTVNGSVIIKGGNPGLGKVLTSDSNGLATWEPLVTLNGTTVDNLSLNNPTIISGNGNGMTMYNNTDHNGVFLSSTINGAEILNSIISNSQITGLINLNGATLDTQGSIISFNGDINHNGNITINPDFFLKILGPNNSDTTFFARNGTVMIGKNSASSILDVNGTITALKFNGTLGDITGGVLNGVTIEDITFSGSNIEGNATINGNITADEFHARLFNGEVFNGGVFNGAFIGNGAALTNIIASSGGEWSDQGSYLHPADSSGAEDIVIGDNTVNNGDIVLYANGSALFNTQGADNHFTIESSVSSSTFTINGDTGHIGIHSNDPTAELGLNSRTVNGGIMISTTSPYALTKHPLIRGPVHAFNTPTQDSFRINYDNDWNGSGTDFLVFDKTDGNTSDPDGGIVFTNTGNDNISETTLIIIGNGNVGIGINNPLAELHINGSTITDKIKITATSPPEACSASNKTSIYFNGTVNEPYYCDGSDWKPVAYNVTCDGKSGTYITGIPGAGQRANPNKGGELNLGGSYADSEIDFWYDTSKGLPNWLLGEYYYYSSANADQLCKQALGISNVYGVPLIRSFSSPGDNKVIKYNSGTGLWDRISAVGNNQFIDGLDCICL